MATQKPLVLINGQIQQIPAGDSLTVGGASSAGVGVTMFNASPTITAAGANNELPVFTLSRTPIVTAEQSVSGTASGNTVAFAAWLSLALGRTTIDAGVWGFTTYAGVDVTGQTTTLVRQAYNALPFATGTVTTTGVGTTRTATASAGTPFAVASVDASAVNTDASYLQTPQGLYQISARTSDTVVTIIVPAGYTNEAGVAASVWKKLFGVSFPNINAVWPVVEEISTETAQASFTVSTTSKLGMVSFVTCAVTRTLTLTYDGTAHHSHITTPIAPLHNEIGGLQGGTTDEYYHLTASEYAGLITDASVDTLTNKRITARVGSTTSSATPTINTDNYDVYKITALAVDITSFTTNLSGAPNDNDILIIEITGTATRAITWGASFEGNTIGLPSTTDGTNMLVVGFLYNTATSKWSCMASTSGVTYQVAGSYAALGGSSTQAFLTSTATADTLSMNAANTTFVLGQASAVNPLMNGAVSIGTSYRYSRQDHVHPVDTSRAAVAGSSSQAFNTAALGVTGDITLNGSARRILGDFSNATRNSRTQYQTSTVNGATTLGLITNGTGSISNIICNSTPDADNSSLLAVAIVGGNSGRINSGSIGTGVALPLALQVGSVDALVISTALNVGIGNTPGGSYKLEVTGKGYFSDTLTLGAMANLPQYTTGTRPAYVKGGVIFDTTLNKMVIGGATAWEAVTSA